MELVDLLNKGTHFDGMLAALQRKRWMRRCGFRGIAILSRGR